MKLSEMKFQPVPVMQLFREMVASQLGEAAAAALDQSCQIAFKQGIIAGCEYSTRPLPKRG